MRIWKCTNTIKRGKPYQKTIAVIFASRLLQMADNQWSDTDNVGYNVHKMKHTQVVSQDGLFQSGAKRHPASCLSAFQPFDYEFGNGKPVQTTEQSGSCPFQKAFEQAKMKTQPTYFQKASTRTVDPPLIDTTDT